MLARSIGAALCAVVLACATTASAQIPPAAASAATPAVDPRAEALVRRYLAATRFEGTLDTILSAMLPIMSDQMSRQQPELTAQDRQMIVDIVRKVMREKMMPKMIDRMVPIYASTFSVTELQALVDFYESPTGRAITDKVPSLAPKSAEVTRSLMPEMMREAVTEVITRMCPGGKCDAAKLPKPAAS
jgi:hypothetical protein